MNKKRIIFNDDFYKVTATILSTKFKHYKKELIDKYKNLDCPVPEEGFSDYKSYQEWYRKMIKSGYNLGEDINKILKSFNLDTNNESFRNNLVKEIFLKIKPWESTVYDETPIKLITRNDKGSKELWVKIELWTKKGDYIKLWDLIENIQKNLKGYRGKEKFRTTFERDFKVYQLYLKTRLKNSGIKLSQQKTYDLMQKDDEYFELMDKFKNGNIDNKIRSIISRFNKLLSNINIL